MRKIPIYIMGKKYLVPSELTVQRAMEYAGFRLIRGCGCRGGACGACAIIYRVPGSYKIKTALACITLVQEAMYILNIPYFPSQKASYDIDFLEPNEDTIFSLYPEIGRCVCCNTCTKMCPQNIPVMDVIACAMRGDLKQAAKLSLECVMCGLCASRCPGELSPHYIALLCRRIYGKYILPRYTHVINRIRQLENGEYNERMKELLQLNPGELKEEYGKAQGDKRIA